MSTTVEYTILAEDGPVTVHAEPATPGLYVYEAPETIDVGAPCRWRLGHHSGLQIARFRGAKDAHVAAVAIADVTDWTASSSDIQSAVLRRMIADSPHAWLAWQRLDFVKRIEDASGHFGNCAHPEPEPDWLPNGGHTDPMCAYVAGISRRCTCES